MQLKSSLLPQIENIWQVPIVEFEPKVFSEANLRGFFAKATLDKKPIVAVRSDIPSEFYEYVYALACTEMTDSVLTTIFNIDADLEFKHRLYTLLYHHYELYCEQCLNLGLRRNDPNYSVAFGALKRVRDNLEKCVRETLTGQVVSSKIDDFRMQLLNTTSGDFRAVDQVGNFGEEETQTQHYLFTDDPTDTQYRV